MVIEMKELNMDMDEYERKKERIKELRRLAEESKNEVPWSAEYLVFEKEADDLERELEELRMRKVVKDGE